MYHDGEENADAEKNADAIAIDGEQLQLTAPPPQ